jgi:hypothetical protein
VLRRVVVLLAVVTTGLVAFAANAEAETTPNGTEYHPIVFPVQEKVTYFDDFGGPRDHHGNDLMGARLYKLLAAADGTVDWTRTEPGRRSGNMLSLEANDGWTYWYIHINNDTPGTDDNRNPPQWIFAPGIKTGSKVKKGQFIAYMGDSGEAEYTQPHLHFEMHRPDGQYINPYTSLKLSQGAGANGLCRYPSNPPAAPNPAAGRGFWTLSKEGNVIPFGNVQYYGRGPAWSADNPYVALAPTPTGHGYWIANAKGSVRGYGDAPFLGGVDHLKLNQPIVGVAATPSGKGYWLQALDGGIFTLGDARFFGSTGAMRLNAPIVSMASTPTGNGYWLIGSDGGVFTFGDARFFGSTGAMRLNAPVMTMTATSTGNGYWLVARDGGMFSFGDAKYYGSIPGLGWCPGPQTVAIARTKTNRGYWILVNGGQVASFGDAKDYGSPAANRTRAVSLAADLSR